MYSLPPDGSSVRKQGEAIHRSNNIDFLRFVFALIVLLTHCYLFFPHSPVWANTCAALAVNGFFVLSGFLVLSSYLSSAGPIIYLWKRVLRIYPAYLVVVLCSLGLIFLGSPRAAECFRTIHPISFALKTLLFMTPMDFSSLPRFASQPMAHTLNLSVWTLSYEVVCYLMIVALGALGTFRLRAATALLCLIVVVLNCIQVSFAPDFFEKTQIHGHSIAKASQTLRLVTYFFAGMTLYLYRDLLRFDWLRVGGAIAVCVVIVIFPRELPLLGNLLLPLAFSYGVLGVGLLRLSRLSRFAAHGDISYGLYLYAWPTQKIVMLLFGPHLNPITMFLVVAPAACVFAALSWIFVEKPAIRLKSSAVKRSEPRIVYSDLAHDALGEPKEGREDRVDKSLVERTPMA